MNQLFEEIRTYHFEEIGNAWDDENPQGSWDSLVASAEFYVSEKGVEFDLDKFKEYYKHFAYIPE